MLAVYLLHQLHELFCRLVVVKWHKTVQEKKKKKVPLQRRHVAETENYGNTNVVHSPSINAWSSVEHVIVGGQTLQYFECRDSTFNILCLSSNLVKLCDSSGIEYIVPCFASELLHNSNTYGKAKVLIDAAARLPKLEKGQNYKITQRKHRRE